jgi:hypothetical protein
MMGEPAVVADPRFLASLGGLAGVLDDESGVVYGVWADLRLAYLGSRWFAFCADNGGPALPAEWPLGRSVAEAWEPPLDAYYGALFAQALTGGKPVSDDYECSSALIFRRFRMTLHPVSDATGLVIVNSLLVARPHDPPEPSAIGLPIDDYVDARGLVTQCMHCRRTRLPASPTRWDWVPALVEHMHTNTSHGLCDVCMEYYHPA